MINLNDIVKDLFHIIMKFMKMHDVYVIIRRVSKKCNNDVKSLSYSRINIINNGHMDKLMESLKSYGLTFTLPNEIEFSYVRFSKERWNFVKKLGAKKMRYYCCSMNNEIVVPKNIKEFRMISCDNKCPNNKKLIAALEKRKSTLKLISIDRIRDLSADDLQRIFCIDLDILFLDSKYTDVHIKITHEHLKHMEKCKSLQKLGLIGFEFDETCNNLELFKDHKLSYLNLSTSNIGINYFANIITPTLSTLILGNTNVDDEFIKQLSIFKKEHGMNLISLDIETTKITSECFKYLNTFELKSLCIGDCEGVHRFIDLDIPSLETLRIHRNIFSENDIVHMLRPTLKNLNISCNKNITNTTLKILCDRKIKLDMLALDLTKVSKKGIIKYLSNMKLSFLTAPYAAYDREKFIQAGVILS